jgi:CRP-like cAMP-binding protein
MILKGIFLMQEYLPILKHSFLFSDIESENLLAMLNCLSVTTSNYKQNEFLFHSGDVIERIGLVLEGSVQLEREDLEGNRTILDKLLPGALFGEAIVCAGLKFLPTSVVARSDCKIMYLDYDKILKTCTNGCNFHTHLIQNMITVLARRNVNLTSKLNCLSKRSTREKLLAYLESQAIAQKKNPFTISFNRQELADYLCVERSAMCTELSKLQADGIVKYTKNSFQLIR